jgi:hypothetical protein
MPSTNPNRGAMTMQISRTSQATIAHELGTAARPAQNPTSGVHSAAAAAYGASAQRTPAAPDTVSVPAIPDPSLESPSMQAALKAAEEVRASLLAQGITPTMSAIDAAKLMALLSD